MDNARRSIDFFSAFVIVISLEIVDGEIVSSSEQTIPVEVPCPPAERRDAVCARQRLIKFGRAELARRGAKFGAVMFNGGTRHPIAADPADDLRLASWR